MANKRYQVIKQSVSLLILITLTFLVCGSSPVRAQCTNYENYFHDAGHILTGESPLDIDVMGQIAFVAKNAAGLQVVDLSNPSFPVTLADLTLEINPNAVLVQGSNLIVTGSNTSGKSVIIYDVTDPVNPIEIGSLIDTWGASYMELIGSTLILISGPTLFSVDLSDFSNPVILDLLVLEDTAGSGYHLTTFSDHAFLSNQRPGFVIVSFEDPSDLKVVSTYSTSPNFVHVSEVVGNYAYLGVEDSGYGVILEIVDVSDPANPVHVNEIFRNASGAGAPYKMATLGTTCYYTLQGHSTHVYDLSNPTSPTELPSLPVEIAPISDMTIVGSFLFQGRQNYGYTLTYVASPEPLVPIASIDTPGDAVSVAIAQGRSDIAYVADGASGVQIVDISNPLAPSIIRTVDTPGYASEIALSGSKAYVADRESGMQIIDITNPYSGSTVIIGSIDTPGAAVDVVVVDTLAFIADSEEGVSIISIDDIEDLFVVGVQDSLSLAQGVDVSGDYAYVADGVEGLQVLNISDPDNPWIVGGVKGRDWTDATDVGLNGTRAYVTDISTGLHVIDIADPSNPLDLGVADTEGQALDVSLSGSYAYISDSESGMQLVDIQDPDNPEVIGYADVPSTSQGTFITENYAYVAAGAAGLQVCPSQCGFSEAVFSEFSDNADHVFYPAYVGFTNESSGYAMNYEWDFGDGFGYSNAIHPSYYYTQPGTYVVTLTATGSGNTDVTTHEITILASEPRINSVIDVPYDQGGFVYVNFTSSGHDMTLPGRSEVYTIQRQDVGQWVTITTSGAYGETNYSVQANTQGDGLESWNTPFRVIAHMDEGIWIGPAVSGFSEDNIAPAIPQNIVWLDGGDLSWNQVPDPDFAYYQIYGSPTSSFTESEPVGATIETTYPAPTGEFPWFFVTAVDDYGNHSTPALSPDFTSAVPTLITAVSLSTAAPNPFNPSTRIEYALPKTGKVHLAVYDLSGHLVKTLVNEVIETGIHSINWHGTDEANRGVSAGAYFYRLEAGGDVIIRRMMLIK